MDQVQQIALQMAYDQLVDNKRLLDAIDEPNDIQEVLEALEGSFPCIEKSCDEDVDDDPMDGDHESALTSAGFGTDEDYCCGESL